MASMAKSLRSAHIFIFNEEDVKSRQGWKHCVQKSLKKVSFNFASEASKVYILSGQKLIKSAKNGQFGEFFF